MPVHGYVWQVTRYESRTTGTYPIGRQKSTQTVFKFNAVKMVRLNERERRNAVQMLLNGRAQSDVARALNVHRSTSSRLHQRLKQNGTTADRPRPGRPRVTSPRQDRYIRLTHLRNRLLTPTETAQNTPGIHNNRISRDTVLNRLRKFGLRARRPYVGLPLTRQRRMARMDWLHQHRPNVFPAHRWRRTLFTDESRFLLYRADGRRRVFRRRGERYNNNCVLERDKFGGGGVMVWGGICHGRKTRLVIVEGNMTAARYRDVILQPVVLPFVRQHNVTLQQDNARPHVARLSMDFMADNNIDVMRWLAFSPDLSPIEHLWDVMDQCVRKRPNPPTSLPALRQALREEWQNIPIAQVNRLVNSMTKRIRAGIAANGGHTRY